MSQLFVAVIGHNGSGKTTFSKKLADDLPFNRVSGDDFREFIYKSAPYFADTDPSYPNEKYSLLNDLVTDYRLQLSLILLRAGQNVVYDGSGAYKKWRNKYLGLVKREFPEVKTVIVTAKVSEATLLNRLSERQDHSQQWIKQYHDLKKHGFEPALPEEADLLLSYKQTNYEDIKHRIQKLLDSA